MRLTLRKYRKLVAALAVIVLLLATWLIWSLIQSPALPAITNRQQSSALLLQNLSRLHESTIQLDTALQTNKLPTKQAAAAYYGQLQTMLDSCRQIVHAGKSGAADVQGTPLQEMLRQGNALCQELGPVAGYSQAQYGTIQPLLESDHSLRRFQHWPPFSHFKNNQLRQSLLKSEERLAKFAIDTDKDFGSTQAILAHLAAGHDQVDSSSDIAVAAAAVRSAQDQALAQRISYWRTSVDIDGLLRAQDNQRRNLCSYLFPGSSAITPPAECQLPPPN